jgi:putative ABC transport system ATP-binding protein
MRKINKERGVTIICATHDLRLLDVCDRMIWVRDGKVQKIDERKNVKVRIGQIGGHK